MISVIFVRMLFNPDYLSMIQINFKFIINRTYPTLLGILIMIDIMLLIFLVYLFID